MTTTTTRRVLALTALPGGALVILGAGDDGQARCVVPPGPLAALLAQAMEPGEDWALTLAADGETVTGASYGGAGCGD